MKIIKYYEYKGVRLEITMESRDVNTHSRMQHLSENQREDIQYQLFLAATYTRLQMQNNESIMD
jgi:hypothetical protein